MKKIILFRDKLTSVINITGLSLGMGACMLIVFWISVESGFDSFHKEPNNIYRVMSYATTYMVDGFPATPGPLGPRAKERMPEIEKQTRIFGLTDRAFTYNDNAIISECGLCVDPDFFAIFSYSLIAGNSDSWLNEPSSIVLTASLSNKLFGTTDVIGEKLRVNNKPLTVTGVIDDVPENSHLKFEYIISVEDVRDYSSLDHWGSFNFNTYFRTVDNIDIKDIGEKLTRVARDNNCPHVLQDSLVFKLQNIKDIYLDTAIKAPYPYFRLGSRKLINNFMIITIIIIIMAGINFLNLSILSASGRNVEVGIRKTYGAGRRHVFRQLLMESVLTILIASAISILIAIFAKPLLEHIAGKQIDLSLSFRLIVNILIVISFAIIISAILPAVILSRTTPLSLFRSHAVLSKRMKIINFRTILLFIQTILTGTLIFVSVFMLRQMVFIRTHELGFNPENVICISLRDPAPSRYSLLKEELLKRPGVNYVSCSDYLWATVNNRCAGCIRWEGKDPDYNPEMRKATIGYDYFKALGVDIIEGRDFDESYPSDINNAFLINETAREVINSDKVIGLKMKEYGIKSLIQDGEIKGVFRDFNYRSLKEPFQPMVVRLMNDSTIAEKAGVMYISADIENHSSVMDYTRQLWEEINPGLPLDLFTLDQTYREQYQSEERNYLLLYVFTFIAITIAILGLIGLIVFLNRGKIKEIGIKKVLGSSIFSIMKNQVSLVSCIYLFSLLFSIPLSLLIIRKLYANYSYTAGINFMPFLLASIIVLLILDGLVILKSMKSARLNPAESLQYE